MSHLHSNEVAVGNLTKDNLLINRDFKVQIHDMSLTVIKNKENLMAVKGASKDNLKENIQTVMDKGELKDLDFFIRMDIQSLIDLIS